MPDGRLLRDGSRQSRASPGRARDSPPDEAPPGMFSGTVTAHPHSHVPENGSRARCRRPERPSAAIPEAPSPTPGSSRPVRRWRSLRDDRGRCRLARIRASDARTNAGAAHDDPRNAAAAADRQPPARSHHPATRLSSVGFTTSARSSGAADDGPMGRPSSTASYPISGAPWTWHSDVLATCLRVRRRRLAPNRRRLLAELGRLRPGPVEITVRTRHQAASVRLPGPRERSTSTCIRPVMIDGIPTTPPARLAVDLGAVVPFDRYEAAMDQLRRPAALTWARPVRHALVARSERGRNGVGALRHLARGALRDPTSGNRRSSSGSSASSTRGLPPPITQLHDRRPRRVVRRSCRRLRYAAERIIVELDSLEWHLNRAGASPRIRSSRPKLRMLGWFVLEVTKDMLAEDADADVRTIGASSIERAPRPSPSRRA